MEEILRKWLDNAPYVLNKEPYNVHMKSRERIHTQYTLDERLGGISSDAFRNIAYIKVLAFAANLFVNPEHAEQGAINQDPTSLPEVIYSLLSDTNTTAVIQFILLEPTESTLNDIKSKGVNARSGARGAVYSAQNRIYELLYKDNGDIAKAYQAAYWEKRRFNYYVTEVIPPFAIFNVTFKGDYSYLNHVKVDLYSAALSSEDERRSMVIWETQDEENYRFFVNNFDNIRIYHARTPSKNELEEWSKKWNEMEEERKRTIGESSAGPDGFPHKTGPAEQT